MDAACMPQPLHTHSTGHHEKASARLGDHEVEKIAFSCLQQQEEGNFPYSYSPNLAEAS